MSPVDPMVADAAPSLLTAGLRIGAMVLLLAAAGYGWVRFLSRQRGSARRLEIQERAFLTRGAGVALLRVDDRRLLVGVSPDGVRLISELDRESEAPSFAGVLAEVTEEEAVS